MKNYRKSLAVALHIFKGVPYIILNGFESGYCPICEKRTFFFKHGNWLRDHYRCIRCLSVPRNRALHAVIQKHFPNWRDLDIHESSPSGPTLRKLRSECSNYYPTYFFSDIKPGEIHQGFRCEDLTRQTFRSELFDLVITQDVLEHIFEPILALKDICRTLKPGGAHVFTVPWYYWSETKVRARKIKGEVEYLEEPDYHRNPIDENGALVVTEWGKDLLDVIYENTEMETTVVKEINRDMGIDAEFIEIFISRKPN